MAITTIKTKNVEHTLPEELYDYVQAVIADLKGQGMGTLMLRYLQQNYTVDAVIPNKIRPGKTHRLDKRDTIRHKNIIYEQGCFQGDPSENQLKSYQFNPMNGMLAVPFEDKATVEYIILGKSTKGSPFLEGNPKYEIFNPKKEQMITIYSDEVKRYVDYFIDRRLFGEALVVVANRFGVQDVSNQRMAKATIKSKFNEKLQKENLLSALLANSKEFGVFNEVLELVYTNHYQIDNDVKGNSAWTCKGLEVVKCDEMHASTFLSLIQYHTSLKNEATEPIETPKIELQTKSTPPKK